MSSNDSIWSHHDPDLWLNNALSAARQIPSPLCLVWFLLLLLTMVFVEPSVARAARAPSDELDALPTLRRLRMEGLKRKKPPFESRRALTPPGVVPRKPRRLPRLAGFVRPVSGVPVPRDPDLLVDAPRRYRGVRARHKSVDFYCERGTPVMAAAAGVVIHIDRDYEEMTTSFRNGLLDQTVAIGDTPPVLYDLLTGRHILIDHGLIDGHHVVTAYNHLSAVRSVLRVGTAVKAGDSIGLVGNSGTSSAARGALWDDCHLDFSILVDEVPLGAGMAPADQVVLFQSILHDGKAAAKPGTLDS